MASMPVVANEMKTKTTDIKNIIMAAFFSPDGVTERILEGPIAENIRSAIKRPGTTVIAKAKVVENLKSEKNCKKIQVNFITPDATFPTTPGNNSNQKPLDIGMQFNVCEDGTLLIPN